MARTKKQDQQQPADTQAPDPDADGDAVETPPQLASTETDWEPAEPSFVTEDFEDYQQEEKERKARGATVKPEVGQTTWRAMPPIKGSKQLMKRGWVHNINNEVLGEAISILAALPDEERAKVATYLGVMDIGERSLSDGFKAGWCQSKMVDGDCFACRVASVLNRYGRSGNAEAEACARELRSREEFFIGAVRLDKREEMEKGPRILQLPKDLYEKLNRLFKNPETGGDFSHPITGFNMVIDRIETGEQVKLPSGKTFPKTKYEVALSRSSTRLANMDWLKKMHDLNQARDVLDEQFMKGLFEGEGKSAPKRAVAPGARQLPAAGADDDWIEDPQSKGDFGFRKDLRAKGRTV
jgi:hypothetical protein